MPHSYKHAQLYWLQENYTFFFLCKYAEGDSQNHAQPRPLPLDLNWAWNLPVQTADSFFVSHEG